MKMCYTGGLWALFFAVCLGYGMASGGRKHSGRHLHPGRSILDDLVTRLDDSIQEHTTRLQRGLPTIHHLVDEPIEHVEEPTIIQTLPEDPDDDTSDYVNAAPWTRGTGHDSPEAKKIDLQKIRLASQNARWVNDNGKCELPLRRCLQVANHFSDPSIKVWPRCALLHRCSDDAGCCNSLEHTCAMKESENVDLYFYVYKGTRAGVQMMTFANHTKCSCQPKATTPEVLPETPCKCPKYFISVTRSGGQCSCDCADGKSTCRKYKRGKRYFSGTDIKCISTGECSKPNCEYGPFVLRKRRCTKRRERERYTTARK